MRDPVRTRAPLLEIKGLSVYYGASHALQGMDLRLASGVLSVVGRNGMGKTTLCNAILGMVPAQAGTISFGRQILNGKAPADIARLGLGYVPQGRRLWRSLTVDEHLRMVASKGVSSGSMPPSPASPNANPTAAGRCRAASSRFGRLPAPC